MSPDVVATKSGRETDDLDLRQAIFLECKERATLLYFLIRLGAAEMEQFKERSDPMSDFQYGFELQQMEKDFNDRNEELGHALVIMNTAAKGPGIPNVPPKTEWLLRWLPKRGSPHLAQGPRNLQEIFWPAMPMPTFTRVYSRFCKYKHYVNPSELHFDGRQIRLHALHTEVCAAGGPQSATAFELWPVIGAKLGFVDYPAVENEPAKSRYNVAIYLQNMYMQHLDEFTKACIAVVKEVNVAPWTPVMNPAGTDTPVTPNSLTPDADAQSQSPASSGPSPVLPRRSSSTDQSSNKSTPQIVNVEQNVADDEDSLPPGRRQTPRPMRWNLPGHVVYSHVTAPFPKERPRVKRPVIAKPDVPLSDGRYPSADELHQGALYIDMLRMMCTRNISQVDSHVIPDEHQEEYNTSFKILHQAMEEIEPKLPLWTCRYPAICIERMVVWLVAVKRQSAEPVFMFTLYSVQRLSKLMPRAAMHVPYVHDVESWKQMPAQMESAIVGLLMEAPFGLPPIHTDSRRDSTAT